MTGSTTAADDRSPLHIAVQKHVGVGNTLLSLRLKELAQLGSGPGYELLKETIEQVRMEQQAGVVVHYGYEVLRRMGEALSQDRDGNTALLRSASTFLKTPLKFHNGTYAATLLKATSEARSILHKLNASGCEHEFRVALLPFVRQSLPDEFRLLVNAGEVAIGSVNPGDRAPSAANRAAYIVYWNKKIEVTLARWKKVAADLDHSWNTSAAARAAAAGAQAKAQASIKPKTVTSKPSPPKRMGMAALGGGVTRSGTGGGRGTSLCLGCGENHYISECKTTTFVPGSRRNRDQARPVLEVPQVRPHATQLPRIDGAPKRLCPHGGGGRSMLGVPLGTQGGGGGWAGATGASAGGSSHDGRRQQGEARDRRAILSRRGTQEWRTSTTTTRTRETTKI